MITASLLNLRYNLAGFHEDKLPIAEMEFSIISKETIAKLESSKILIEYNFYLNAVRQINK